jgi:hypothetical protein
MKPKKINIGESQRPSEGARSAIGSSSDQPASRQTVDAEAQNA